MRATRTAGKRPPTGSGYSRKVDTPLGESDLLSAVRDAHRMCVEGIASYYDVVVNGQTNKDATW